MSVSAALLRLYPRAFRLRWGEDLRAEAESAGWRCWPNLLTGALDMWLHPAIWPANRPTQRASRTAAMAILVTVGCWLLAHFTTEPGAPGYAMALNGCAILLVIGLALLTPVPRPRAIGALLRRSVRLLAAPLLLAAGVVLVVNSAPDPVQHGALRLLLLLAWWGSWALGVIQGCRVVAGLGPDLVIPPALGRTRLGVGVLTGASAFAAGTIAVFAALSPAPVPVLLGVAAASATFTCAASRGDLAAG